MNSHPCAAAISTRSIFTWTCPNSIPVHSRSRPPSPMARSITYRMCDWIDNAITLQMANGEAQIYGYQHLPCRGGSKWPRGSSSALPEAFSSSPANA